ncbi:hypothetical protein MAR_012175 [Mya arenaria]|uniref:Uncharacterized protein n=1 Tax=Mya arenaria TaxID=6604 RepID=A0ABY7G5A5_MYAAR|nr:hypothetical protein MAR_012175 [Mya arenaria]
MVNRIRGHDTREIGTIVYLLELGTLLGTSVKDPVLGTNYLHRLDTAGFLMKSLSGFHRSDILQGMR